MANQNQSGVSLIELSIAAAVLTVALLLITVDSINTVGSMRGLARVAARSAKIGDVIHRVEKIVRGGLGYRPSAWLTSDVGTGTGADIELDSLRGFPDRGLLLLNPGTTNSEYIRYDSAIFDLDADYRALVKLTRGVRSGTARRHAAGAAARWGAFGEVLVGSPSQYDGQSTSASGPVFFRGEATGFVFQRPITIGTARQRGSVVDGTARLDGWSAIYFDPVSTLDEAQRGTDLNQDGDMDDVFDLGRLRRRSWAPIGLTTLSNDLAESPTVIVQEQGAWGSADLDNDGFADPMFLWHERTSKLQIQLVLWVGGEGRTNQLTKIESVVRLERSR